MVVKSFPKQWVSNLNSLRNLRPVTLFLFSKCPVRSLLINLNEKNTFL